ncbi:TPA: pleiotropic regulatory protein RsmS [Enterobacter hormaechei]|uniref:pleiotropic regulatory protein RsmS n=1 Tax=Enterobacter hormaechei TaxID=158836 RepID=UPI00126132F3|nr:pleiotropic regulatory protein RsmS [Enterobacter hormaechei]MBJ6570669.1 pleiotropic regulatory protein RsmS [Enterobacter hormaechei]MBK4490754.1 pleiotropic regulatory protein RsmS [Enterobacter hormaechei]MDR9882353.1 pleiotropic regulatory protein RsmS [Enterobacter hormaechei subsp. steigerwaltii]QPD72122.1 pleiotropic regulatory protein RsmS [Enterobacter hormaechei subsp. steigerwaltii]HBL5409669.1 pleiotropic regulatory protein RsmS [Enterobacter hormaechei]
MSLENAPDEVKLAFDLIMLLENHEIPAETVLKALEIVRRDFEGKLPPHPTLSPEGRGK